MRLSRKYLPLFESNKPIILVSGGRGSGKSFAVSTFIKFLLFEQGHTILFMRYTLTSAELSIIPEFIKKMEKDGSRKYFKVTKGEIINEFSGSQIWFRGIKTSSGNQTAHLKSITGLTTFVGDEMEEWLDEEEFDKMRLSIREKGVRLRIVLVMNPSDSSHFIYRNYLASTHQRIEIDGVSVQISTHPDVEHIHTTYLDNQKHLSKDFIAQIERMREKEPKKYAYQIIGQWRDRAQGVVFSNWSIVDGLPSEAKLLGYGLDFGFSNDPTALVGLYKLDGAYLYHQLIYQKGLSNGEIAQLMKSLGIGKGDLVIADSSEPKSIYEIGSYGFSLKGCVKGRDSVVFGLQLMSEHSFKVTKTSVEMIRELRNYVWATDRDGRVLNRPIDAFNHCIDAARYISVEKLKKRAMRPLSITGWA